MHSEQDMAQIEPKPLGPNECPHCGGNQSSFMLKSLGRIDTYIKVATCDTCSERHFKEVPMAPLAEGEAEEVVDEVPFYDSGLKNLECDQCGGMASQLWRDDDGTFICRVCHVTK